MKKQIWILTLACLTTLPLIGCGGSGDGGGNVVADADADAMAAYEAAIKAEEEAMKENANP